jgi:hypothetical protein
MNSAHITYRQKQNGIYAGIKKAHDQLGTTTNIENDVKEPQGAYLIAWRHPEIITSGVSEVSFTIASLTKALTYDSRTLHTTLSDHGLAPGLSVNPAANADHAETLDSLTKAVRSGLDSVGPHAIGDRKIAFGGYISNGKSVIAPGQANDEVLDINEAVKQASAAQGIDGGAGLRGAWGAHMTVNRFTADADGETSHHLAALLDTAPRIGESLPIAIDVGYLAVSQAGFEFTTHERFPLVRN